MLDYIDPSQDGGNVWLVILAFVLSLALAALAGYLLWRFIIIGLVLLGGVAGFLAGTLLYNLVLVLFLTYSWALAVTTITCAFIGMVLANKLKDEVIIFSTALLGSYAFVRGFSMFIGGYPNEFTLYDEISAGTVTYSPAFIGYLAAIVLLTIIGVFYQKKHSHDCKSIEEHAHDHKWEGYTKIN
jgi:hypothetical protein